MATNQVIIMFFIKTQSGFTLVELMITVAIIAILASVALPSYQDSVRQTRRAAAQADLMELASYMERIYTAQGSYASISGALPDLGTEMYNIDFSVGPTQSTYTLRAQPIDTQLNDTCGTLTLAHTAQEGADTANCW